VLTTKQEELKVVYDCLHNGKLCIRPNNSILGGIIVELGYDKSMSITPKDP